MKTIIKNDILEILKLAADESTAPRYVQNSLKELDQRCKYALSMIQAWGMMAALGDLLAKEHDTITKPVAPSDLVMRVCEVVDAAWNEMEHRGWIINVDSLGE